MQQFDQFEDRTVKLPYKFQSKWYWNWEVIPLEMNTKFRVFFKNVMLKMLIKLQCFLWEICSFPFLKRCCFFCMTSLAVASSTLKTSMKFWSTAFKFWLRPWIQKSSLISDVLSDQVWWCNIKLFLSYSKNCIYFT